MGADELTDALLATTDDPEAWADVAYDQIVPSLGGDPWCVYVAPDLKVAMLQKPPAGAESV